MLPRILAALGVIAGALFAPAGCGPEPATSATDTATTGAGETGETGASATTTTTESDSSTATGAATTGQATEPTGSTGPGDMCEEFLDAPELREPIRISVRNTAQVPLFLPFGDCSSPTPFTIEALSDGASWSTFGCSYTCENQFCTDECLSIGSIMITPGGVADIFTWDGLLTAPRVLPAACWDGDADIPCDVLRSAEAGEHHLTVLFSQELLGCDPDLCTCDLEGFDFCQVWNEGEPVPQFSAEVVFVMPTAGPIAIDLSL